MRKFASFSMAVAVLAALFFTISLAAGEGFGDYVLPSQIACAVYVVLVAVLVSYGRLSPQWWGSVVAVAVFGLWLFDAYDASFASATQYLGSGAVAFLALASLVSIGSWLVLATHHLRFPVIWTVLIWVAVASLWADNHAVRRIDAAPQPVSVRPSLVEAAKAWHECAGRLGGPAPPPMVVVATAGGATRAALWTATVLGLAQDRLADRQLSFYEHIYALSGVSGGAVGLAFTVAHMRERAARPALASKSLAELGLVSLAPDFLSGVVAGMMFTDLIYAIVPVVPFPDRAEALEVGWEYGWRLAYGKGQKTRGLDTPFPDVRAYGPETPCDKAGPVLLLNGTHEESGRRIVTANVQVEPETFIDAVDFDALADGPIRLSTAALNTARFPYVSPAGTLYKPAGQGVSTAHILDGGYYENYGAQTAGEVLKAAEKIIPDAAVKPIVVLISSDTDLRLEDIDPDRCTRVPDALPSGRQWANDLLAPPVGLFATRSARGVAAAKELCEKTQTRALGRSDASKPVFLHFRMCKVEGELAPGLTWKLSRESQNFIAYDLPCSCHNGTQFERLFQGFGLDQTDAHTEVESMCKALKAEKSKAAQR